MFEMTASACRSETVSGRGRCARRRSQNHCPGGPPGSCTRRRRRCPLRSTTLANTANTQKTIGDRVRSAWQASSDATSIVQPRGPVRAIPLCCRVVDCGLVRSRTLTLQPAISCYITY